MEKSPVLSRVSLTTMTEEEKQEKKQSPFRRETEQKIVVLDRSERNIAKYRKIS